MKRTHPQTHAEKRHALADAFLARHQLRLTVVYAGPADALYPAHQWNYLFRDASDRIHLARSIPIETATPHKFRPGSAEAILELQLHEPDYSPPSAWFGYPPPQSLIPARQRSFEADTAAFRDAGRFFSKEQIHELLGLREELKLMDSTGRWRSVNKVGRTGNHTRTREEKRHEMAIPSPARD